MTISWTFSARKSYFAILKYLEDEWSEKEILKFIEETERKIELLRTHPNLGLVSKKKKKVRRCLILEINSLFYRVKPRNKQIELLLFWNNRQNPYKLRY